MGAVCAVVYLMCMIAFMPFPFYEYIVASTSGGGNREITVDQEVETGRLLHRFPHNKVCCPVIYLSPDQLLTADIYSSANTSPQSSPSSQW